MALNPPPKQAKFAEQLATTHYYQRVKQPAEEDLTYKQLIKDIYFDNEPLFVDCCISCAGCTVAAAASLSWFPDSSLWQHIGTGSIVSCLFFSSMSNSPCPDIVQLLKGPSSELLIQKIKKEATSCFTKKHHKEKDE